MNQANSTMAPKDEPRISSSNDVSSPVLPHHPQHDPCNKHNGCVHGAEVACTTTEATTASPEYVLNVAFFSFVFFCILETVFAFLANSQSMLADAEAMSIDALTYLFNLAAETIKNRPLSTEMLKLSKAEQDYYIELRRLYLELIPPSISVVVLMAITVFTCMQAFESLFGEGGDGDGDEEDVSVVLMFVFSGANLLLDIVNVTCFSRANATYGLNVMEGETRRISQTLRGRESLVSAVMHEEGSHLIVADEEKALNRGSPEPMRFSSYGTVSARKEEDDDLAGDTVNLNMCSAWTHVCADTLRSTAVLIAAGIAFVIPSVDGEKADSAAAIAVSIIILVSLVPLIQGLILTAISIYELRCNPPHKTQIDLQSSSMSDEE